MSIEPVIDLVYSLEIQYDWVYPPSHTTQWYGIDMNNGSEIEYWK